MNLIDVCEVYEIVELCIDNDKIKRYAIVLILYITYIQYITYIFIITRYRTAIVGGIALTWMH